MRIIRYASTPPPIPDHRVSMPARQLSFLREIQDAVASCHRLVLVVGQGAIGSHYVT